MSLDIKKMPYRFYAVLIVLFSILIVVHCSDKGKIQIEPISYDNFDISEITRNFHSVIKEYTREFEADIESDGIGGMAVGVVTGVDLFWSRGFGYADRENRMPATPDHIFRIGSITKSFTAVLLMALYEDGIVNLDDPVEKYVPEIRRLKNRPGNSGPITLRQLACHSAGIAREPDLPGAADGPVGNWMKKTVECIGFTSFIAAPGEEFHYSNIGYAILGLALSMAANKPYCDLVEEMILKPLGMSDSFLILSPENITRVATGYAIRNNGGVDTKQPFNEHAGRGYKMPNGAMYSTIQDLTSYIAFISGAGENPILSDDSRRELIKPQSPDGQYGYGFRLYEGDDGFKIVWHGGSVSGYNAMIAYEPDTKAGIIMLRNYKGGTIDLAVKGREMLQKLLTDN